MDHFELVSEYKPTGDQPQAIAELVKGFKEGNQFETLLGVTGSGKTFTMANIIQALNKPTLVIAHNKTLAAQLYSEFKEFFPNNAVEYFVSYYDYYQPEAYVPSTDTYIEKDSSINDEIDKLRHSATAALIERKDVIVVSSVSCIYGIGDRKSYAEMMISLRPGMQKDRDDVIRELIDIQYVRNELDFKRGTFRVKGDVLEIVPISTFEDAVRIEFFGDEIDADKIDYVAECLLKAETVYLVGIGSDGVMVKYMSDYLTTMGKKCIAIYDEGISLRQKILTASSKDFILLASFPTVQPDEYWTASFAMEHGIGAALITDSELTAAALGMPCFFKAKVPMESFFNSSVFVMILCDMILMKMYDLDESGIAAALKRYDEVTGNA